MHNILTQMTKTGEMETFCLMIRKVNSLNYFTIIFVQDPKIFQNHNSFITNNHNMNQKFKIDQYQICTNFKSDNALSISAEFLPTGQFFINDSVELIRIKKDTVLATLQKKSNKNLACQLEQLVQEQSKYLMMSFIVNFDYLPEFREEIRLENVEQKGNKTSLQIGKFHAQIDQMETAIARYSKNGFLMHQETMRTNLSSWQTILSRDIAKGQYLVRVSGIFTDDEGYNRNYDLNIQMSVGDKTQIKSKFTTNSMDGYSYPFNFSEVINSEQEEGELLIKMICNGANMCNLTNTHIAISPVLEIDK